MTGGLEFDGRTGEAWAAFAAALHHLATTLVDAATADVLVDRAEVVFADLFEALDGVYGEAADWSDRPESVAARPDLNRVLDSLAHVLAEAVAERSADLRRLDHQRTLDPGWFGHESMVGYCCYTHRFAGTLRAVGESPAIEHLASLGVRYLHLMPVLRPRPGDNDGGYAVEDYREVDPRIGTMADLEWLAGTLRGRGISLCVDLVVNHTADTHAWAVAARSGDVEARSLYRVYPDRTGPDAWERTARDVFPDTAPGNFTLVDGLGWVWTTFYPFQWDLDYGNPEVFRRMLTTMLFLANRGVEVLRLDAVPFLWKRKGTDCQNQPEAHRLLQAFRALVRIAAPAAALLAEAIVAPDDLVGYLGAHEVYRPECDLAYHNQLMVLLWSSVASQDVVLMTHALQRMRTAPPQTQWVTFLRSHDDIGWSVHDRDAATAGLHGWSHRRFLAEFYAGQRPGSFSRGVMFQDDPQSGDARTCGGSAALAGVAAALEQGDGAALDAAVRRLLLMWSVLVSFTGMPLLWMGDEVALADDPDWAAGGSGLSVDARWLHRPAMDWSAVARAAMPGTVEQRVRDGIGRLLATRRSLPVLRAGGRTEVFWTGNDRVLAYRRTHPRARPMLALVNMSAGSQSVHASLPGTLGLGRPLVVLGSEAATGSRFEPVGGNLALDGLGWVWLADG